MHKATFNVKVKMPKGQKALKPGDTRVDVFHVKIDGVFNADETGTLEMLMKSWRLD